MSVPYDKFSGDADRPTCIDIPTSPPAYTDNRPVAPPQNSAYNMPPSQQQLYPHGYAPMVQPTQPPAPYIVQVVPPAAPTSVASAQQPSVVVVNNNNGYNNCCGYICRRFCCVLFILLVIGIIGGAAAGNSRSD